MLIGEHLRKLAWLGSVIALLLFPSFATAAQHPNALPHPPAPFGSHSTAACSPQPGKAHCFASTLSNAAGANVVNALPSGYGPGYDVSTGRRGSATTGMPPFGGSSPSSGGWLAPDWSANAGYGASIPGWYTDTNGAVHLSGAVKQIATGGNPWIIGTLPVGVRPNRAVYTIVHTFAGTYADLAIGTDGNISVIGPRPPAAMDLGFVSLEGITYQR